MHNVSAFLFSQHFHGLRFTDSRSIPSQGTVAFYGGASPLKVFRADGASKLTNEQKANATLLAKNLDMYRVTHYHAEMVPQLHQVNPDLKVLLYRDMRAIYNYGDEWQVALDSEWILTDSSGNLFRSTIRPENHMVDIRNKVM